MMKRQRPSGQGVAAGLVGTLVIHAGLAGALFAGATDRQPAPPVYRVSLVAAPRPEPGRRPPPQAVERPAEQPSPAPPKPTTQRPAPPRTETRPTPARTEAPPRARAAVEPLPGERPSTGSAIATVETPGIEFPFPEYLARIVSEVYGRWQRPTSGRTLEAEVQFLVHRDGSVTNLHFSKRSGDFSFDLEAHGAIESAGASRAFGPLPDGYDADVLPVTFFFTPRGR